MGMGVIYSLLNSINVCVLVFLVVRWYNQGGFFSCSLSPCIWVVQPRRLVMPNFDLLEFNLISMDSSRLG
jgi:hypothetical protein